MTAASMEAKRWGEDNENFGRMGQSEQSYVFWKLSEDAKRLSRQVFWLQLNSLIKTLLILWLIFGQS